MPPTPVYLYTMPMETRNCQNCKNDFIIEAEDFDFYDKMQVPAPTFCPQCRLQRRMLFRNFKTLHNRPSSKSGQTLVSMYSSNVPFPVYEAKEWWADDWDGLSYERDVDFSRPFFEQLKELFDSVPRMALMNTKSTQCEYSNMTYASNNCHLIFGCVEDENCDYGHIVWNSKDSIDTLYLFKSEFCYDCVDCLSCNTLFYSQECESCADSIGLYNCKSCTTCIGCVGLRQKSYYIFNQPVSKEDYYAFKEKYPLHKKESIEYILQQVATLRKEIPEPALFGYRNVSVSGNHVYNAHHVHNSFDIKSGENSKYCYTVKKCVESYDVSFSPESESGYELLNCVGSHILGSHLVMDSSFVSYSDTCYGSNNLFGCAGLKQKKYCILNKQYTKEAYLELVPKIIEHMKNTEEYGQFFPKELSPFAYNESIVNEYLPLSKEQAVAFGFTWLDVLPKTIGQGTMTFDSLPDNPQAYDATLLKEIFTCTECERNFRLIDRELTFYQRFNIAIPQQCFNCRHQRRMHSRYPRMLREDLCDCCGKDISISVSEHIRSDRKIYCEDCYKREVL